MFRQHVTKNLSAFCHGELSDGDARRISAHLHTCGRCRAALEEIKLGIRLAEHLNLIPAPHSMWGEIEPRLAGQLSPPPRDLYPRLTRFVFSRALPRPVTLVAVLLLVVAGVIAINRLRLSKESWGVAWLARGPLISSTHPEKKERLVVGEWLETDVASRAMISVANIGQVELDPQTRVRLVSTNSARHRLALTRGTIHATILAPPRLFWVDTPSAVAIDYGCAYTLSVDELGRSLLRVTAGQVALELNNRQVMISAGYLCETRPRIGPGTPYNDEASELFRSSLTKFDFEEGGEDALNGVLAEARAHDALTLWYLLPRISLAQRQLVFDRLAKLVALPEGVTREGVLRLDEAMLNLWKEKIRM